NWSIQKKTKKRSSSMNIKNFNIKQIKQFAENNTIQIIGSDNITSKKDNQTTPLKQNRIDDYYLLHSDNDIFKNNEDELQTLVEEEEEEISPLNNVVKYILAMAKRWNSICAYIKLAKFMAIFKDGTDLLDCGKESYTEVDIITKATSYIQTDKLMNYIRGESFCPLTRSENFEKGPKCDIRFLSSSSVDLGEWEFAVRANATKAIGDRCRSARVNQSILNGMLKLNLTDDQAKMAKVPFLQVTDTYGQMLLEDCTNGFYLVFPEQETYEETSNMLEELDHGYNKLECIFKKADYDKQSHYKSNFISEPWWTPKKNITSQLSTAIKDMDVKN
ncbi:14747_t:CDS:2, partial [Dentiscutata erythropus]